MFGVSLGGVENLTTAGAETLYSAALVVQRWLNSPGHSALIFTDGGTDGVTRIGVGMARNGGGSVLKLGQ